MYSVFCQYMTEQGMDVRIRQSGGVLVGFSGGADSVALLFALYLLKEKLDFRLEAAHFNHQLRGAESDSDAEFVRKFCDFHEKTYKFL